MVGFEIYSTAKILSIPNDSMAFSCRGPQSNVLINVSWLAEDMDKVDVNEVRKRVKEIIGAVQGDRVEVEPSYGNYGMSSTNMYMIIRAEFLDGGEVLSGAKVRKLYGANYRKLQFIKAKYEQVTYCIRPKGSN